MQKRRVGIVGYGHLGQYLTKAIEEDLKDKFELAFVYNRSPQKIDIEDKQKILVDLDDFASRNADLIVEVAHPKISEQYAARFLEHADYMAGSPTAFANSNLEQAVRKAAQKDNGHGVYLPQGALWYLDRIVALSEEKRLMAMSITMKKHPLSIRYSGPLDIPLEKVKEETTIFKGSVRELCRYAPNNVNTMAVAALAATDLGFDNVQASLVVDPNLTAHIIEIELVGPGEPGNCYLEKGYRYNPAKTGAVTGSATYQSFLKSMCQSYGGGNGVHFR